MSDVVSVGIWAATRAFCIAAWLWAGRILVTLMATRIGSILVLLGASTLKNAGSSIVGALLATGVTAAAFNLLTRLILGASATAAGFDGAAALFIQPDAPVPITSGYFFTASPGLCVYQLLCFIEYFIPVSEAAGLVTAYAGFRCCMWAWSLIRSRMSKSTSVVKV